MRSLTLAILVFCYLGNVLSQQDSCPVSLKDGSLIKCFFANFAFNSFTGVRNICKMLTAKNGGLAVLNTKEKVDSLVSNSDYFLAGEPALSFWIGLKFHAQKRMWVWQDGTQLSGGYENWATINKGEVRPDKEYCAAINLYSAMAKNASADQGRWHIDDCEAPRPSLCETNVKTLMPQPKLSELVKFNPQRSALYYEKQPKGHSCAGGLILARYTEEMLCQQFCLVNTECVGYIVPNDGKSCFAKGKGCKSTFAETENTFFKKMHKEKGWLSKKADLESDVE